MCEKGKAKPKCMEKPLDWNVATKNLCPKCGSEMASCVYPDGSYSTECPNCGYGEQHESGHEEKVGGDPSVH